MKEANKMKRVIIVGDHFGQDIHNATGQAEVRAATCCAGLRRSLKESPDVDLVIARATMSDGNWCDVVRLMVELDVQAELLVVGELGGRMFELEVASRGARLIGFLDMEVLDSLVQGGPAARGAIA